MTDQPEDNVPVAITRLSRSPSVKLSGDRFIELYFLHKETQIAVLQILVLIYKLNGGGKLSADNLDEIQVHLDKILDQSDHWFTSVANDQESQ